jgi:hypothetical protein
MGRFKRTDSQVTAALFRLLTEQESKGGQHIAAPRRGVDLASCDAMAWLLPGFIAEKDQTLTYGAKGSGKTKAALRQAFNLIDGMGFLGGEDPARPCRVLFVASDSGVEPLKESIEKSGLGNHPALVDGRFVVWAHAANQGQTAWDAGLTGCLGLLEAVRGGEFGLVILDSAKAVTSRADLNYLDNTQVTALLTFFKYVICEHTAVQWLHHDGTEHGSSAGAKAWAEIPSVVHRIEQPMELVDSDGSGTTPTKRPKENLRVWQTVKTRKGSLRTITYSIDGSGDLVPAGEAKGVSGATGAILAVLRDHAREGGRSLTTAEIITEARSRWGFSRKAIENALPRLASTHPPEVVRPAHGRYALAPRLLELLKEEELSKVSPLTRGVFAENSVIESDLQPPFNPPQGGSGGFATPLQTLKGVRGGVANPFGGLESGEKPPLLGGKLQTEATPAEVIAPKQPPAWHAEAWAIRQESPDLPAAAIVNLLKTAPANINGKQVADYLKARQAS